MKIAAVNTDQIELVEVISDPKFLLKNAKK